MVPRFVEQNFFDLNYTGCIYKFIMSFKNRIGNSNGYVKQRLGTAPNNFQRNIGITSQNDARFRLIEKKREKITDARERLAEIAKGEDARKKLDKKRNQNAGSIGKEKILNITKNKVSVAGLGNQLKNRPLSKLHNSNSRGVVSLGNLTQGALNKPSTFIGIRKTKGVLQSKTQMKAGSLTRTVNSGIPNTIVKKPPTINKASSSDRYHPLPNNPNVVTIRNDNIGNIDNARGNQRSGNLPQLKGKRLLQKTSTSLINSSGGAGMPSRQSGSSSRNGLQLMKTVRRNSFSPYEGSPSHPFMQEIKPARLKITPNNYVDYDVDNDRYRMPQPPVSSLKRNSYDDYDPYYGPSKKQALSSSIVSRLDQSQQISSGYKVIVTNLHPVVTGEDIEELFGNIGPIKYARLIREGIAEVLFHEKVDAYRSVEVYHNRQLDGQAMSVTVVSKGNEMPPMSSPSYNRYSPPPVLRSNYSPPRPFAPPPQVRRTGHQMNASQPSSRPKSVLRAAGGSDYGGHSSTMSTQSNKRVQKLDVAPDIHAIHHALFSSKSSGGQYGGNSDPQVVIRLPKGPLRGSK
ncbi:UNVERIFIED_CONTAM: hypothetical protein RMT77_010356 [Armadillidium vulgare]